MYDVAVVGGSLAGATTALHLAAAGRRVVLIERLERPRRKACGEGLFPRGVEELTRLGLLGELRVRGAPLHGVRFHVAEADVEAPFGPASPAGLGIQRTDLDPRIVAHAQAAGVEIWSGVAVRTLLTDGNRFTGVRTDAGEVHAQVVIGADGIASRVRKQAGLDRLSAGDRYGVSAHVRLVGAAPSVVDVYFDRGYEVYVTPVGGQVVNVAALVRKDSLADVRGDLAGWFARKIAPHCPLGPTATLVDTPLVAGPFGTACVRPWRQNLVLVGDAAGFFDAISGEGMSTTLVSARDCAAAVDSYLGTHDEAEFRRYAIRRAALVRNSDLFAKFALAVAARPGIARVVLRHLARRPDAFARMVAISVGELPLRALRAADIRALMLGR